MKKTLKDENDRRPTLKSLELFVIPGGRIKILYVRRRKECETSLFSSFGIDSTFFKTASVEHVVVVFVVVIDSAAMA